MCIRDRDYPVLSKALNNLAWIYGTQGNYTIALECHLKALKINEQLRDKSAMVANYVNIAGIQSDQREYKDALDYLHKALKISEEIKDNFKTSSCLDVYKRQSRDYLHEYGAECRFRSGCKNCK